MDFGKPHQRLESLASKSKIRFLEPVSKSHASSKDDEDEQRNVALDNELIDASNQSAAEFFLGPGAQVDKSTGWMIDASYYTERLTPSNDTIQEGDLVVIQEAFDKLNFVYCKKGDIFNNRNGHFHHSDFIGKPFGTKIRSRNLQGYGFCYLLKPTPELWTRSLNHRTQVVHELDQSQILFQLYIQPNDIVVESGTGSGAMSHAILRTIAPAGHLHTYEYNRHRCETAAEEFRLHGLGHLVTVHHKDVCRGIVEEPTNSDNNTDDKQHRVDRPGFDLPGQSVDAVFLDLPEPWLAVPHAAYILRPDARIGSYSPCVEQTQRTVQALEASGFHSIKTMEYRLQEHYVDEVEYEPFPKEKRPRIDSKTRQKATPDASGEDTGIDEDEDAGCGGIGAGQAVSNTEKNVLHKKRKLVARPFVMMRGHTAFLTFASAGIEKQADSNAISETNNEHGNITSGTQKSNEK
jgi:tRNA (adenine57-N1/adenine58-N1)-methyltransferase